MNANPWFRCYADIADNYKLKMLAFEDRWHYIAILSCKCSGMLDGKRSDFVFRGVAARLGISKSELEEVARRLADNYLIDEKTLQPVGWDDRQFSSDNSTNRVRKYRKNNESCNVSETFPDRFGNAPEQNRTEQKETKKNPPLQPAGFAEFWAAYPRKVGKGAAEKAWSKAKINGSLPSVLEAIERQIASDQWRKGFIPNPLTWLNQRRWEDEVTVVPGEEPIMRNGMDQRRLAL